MFCPLIVSYVLPFPTITDYQAIYAVFCLPVALPVADCEQLDHYSSTI